MTEQLANAGEAPRVLRRHGSLFAVVIDGSIPKDGNRIDTIIEGLASEADTPSQICTLEEDLRPALEKFGTE